MPQYSRNPSGLTKWSTPTLSCCACAYLLLLFGDTSLAAQETTPSSPTLTLQVETFLVPLEVSVTNPKGRPVLGLRSGDFEIREDGVVQRVRSFHAVQSGAIVPHTIYSGGSSGPVQDPSHEEAHSTIFVLDEVSTQYEDMARGRAAVERCLDRLPGDTPLELTLLAITSSGLQELVAPTRERGTVAMALQKRHPSLPVRLHAGNDVAGAGERLAEALASLRNVARSLQQQPGSKQVIWFGRGFPTLNIANQDADQTASLAATMHSTAALLLAARIQLSILDPAGVSAYSSTGADDAGGLAAGESHTLYDPQSSFEGLPQQTGGAWVTSRNDLDGQVVRIVEGGIFGYELTYAPANRNFDGRFRRIAVAVKRPGLNIRTRDGYFADLYPPATPEGAAADLREALESPLPAKGLPISGSISQNGAPTVEIEVQRGKLRFRTLVSGDRRAEFTVVLQQRTANGAVVGILTKELAITSRGENAGGPIQLRIPLNLKPEATSLRIVVRDAESTFLGSEDLSIPASH